MELVLDAENSARLLDDLEAVRKDFSKEHQSLQRDADKKKNVLDTTEKVYFLSIV